MAELTITTFLTLDGVMQAPGGAGEDPRDDFAPYEGWLVPHADDDFNSAMAGIFSAADAFLLGRFTYDIFAAYWPKVTDPKDPIAAKLNGLPKFVASRGKKTFKWERTEWLQDVVHGLPALKKRFPREIQVHGSGGLAQTLIMNDLIDEYRLLTFPVVIGTGRRFFGSGAIPANLSLVKSSTTSKGVVISVYRRGSGFRKGSFT